jgi:excinuclease ABC subunit C
MKQLVEDIFSPEDKPSTGQVPTHEIDELLLLSSWFRRFPTEMKRTKQVS